MRRSFALLPLAILVLAMPTTFAACSSDDVPATPDAGTPEGESKFSTPPENLDDIKWEPKFEPDFVALTPLPGVEATTATEQDKAVVKPDALEFSAADVPSVRDWQPGRLVTSAPGAAGSGNPLGFARRVRSVKEENGKFIVETEPVAIQDVVEGSFLMRADTQGTDIDLTGLDPAWVAKNLYYTGIDRADLGLEPLRDDPLASEVSVAPGSGGLTDWIASTANGAAASVQAKMNQLASTEFNGSYNDDAGINLQLTGVLTRGIDANANFNPTITVANFDYTVFKDWEFKKQLGKKIPLEVFIKGDLKVRGKATVNPGIQIGMKIPLTGGEPVMTFDLQTRVNTMVGLNTKLEAGISAANIGGKGEKLAGKELTAALEKGGNAVQSVLNDARESLFKDKDTKPGGDYTKVLWISKPKKVTLQAGPVPVVLTATLQLNLVCNFEAKASISADVEHNEAFSLNVQGSFKPSTGVTLGDVSFDRRKNTTVSVLGGGELVVGCGLVPRVNAFLYDTLGINVGFRAGLYASAKYESKCQPTTTTPKGELELALKAGIGIPVGGRVQVPGSSFLGKKGEDLGVETPAIEPWNKEFELLKKTWEFAKGIGYCTPTCQDTKLTEAEDNGDETDIDCGGSSCSACGVGKSCERERDCAGYAACSSGKCGPDRCTNGQRDGLEADVDCGSVCAGRACVTGKRCSVGPDCQSGFCNRRTSLCVATHCDDGERSGDETGTDCGGSCAKKCETGTPCALARDCASGFSNGFNCVATACENRQKDGDETGVDCGGADANCRRCGRDEGCLTNTDCFEGESCGPDKKCVRAPGESCTDGRRNRDETDVDCGGVCSVQSKACREGLGCMVAADCESAICTSQKTCAAPSCTDQVKNGPESDVDCGGSCNTKCAPGKSCTINADCVSNKCQATRCTGDGTVGGTVSGLVGGMNLANGTDTISVSQNGSYVFSQPVVVGGSYAVRVSTQPVGQFCTVANGTGTMGLSAITNVDITCVSDTHSLGGAVSGLSGTVVLGAGSGNSVTLSNSGTYSFPNRVAFGTMYAVTVTTQPAGQTCTVANGSGTMGIGDVTNVNVTCSNQTYAVGGSVSGLTGGPMVLTNGSEQLNVNADGAFAFTTKVAFGSTYNVLVQSKPAALTCSVASGSGTMGAADVTNVSITCSSSSFAIGGSVAGASGAFVLRNNGVDLNVSGSGPFTFADRVATGGAYGVTVATQPPGQTCTVNGGSGTATADVTNVSVSCTGATYTVGGTVTGLLAGTTLRLGSTPGVFVNVNGSGAFTFSERFDYNGTYSVGVDTPAPGHDCSVSGANGTVTSNVSSVAVNCTRRSYYVQGVAHMPLQGGGNVTLRDQNARSFDVGGGGDIPFTINYGTDALVPYGDPYAIAILTNTPGITCTVTANGSGTMPDFGATNVDVTCIRTPYTIGGSATGIVTTNGTAGLVRLRDQVTNEFVDLAANGTYAFTQSRFQGSGFNVVVDQTSPNLSCGLVNGNGSVNGGNFTEINVTCTERRFALGGLASGLRAPVTLANGGDQLFVPGNGSYTFVNTYLYGTPFDVTRVSMVTGQTCTIQNPVGTITANVTNVNLNCVDDRYDFGGTITGLVGEVTLESVNPPSNNFNQTFFSNGDFRFTGGIGFGGTYNVMVRTQPNNQVCSVVSGGFGMVDTPGPRTNVMVNCVTNSKKVFVTENAIGSGGANFGGVLQADSFCQTAAQNAGKTGTFKAWVSDSNAGIGYVSARFTPYNGPYARFDGVEVAPNWNHFTSFQALLAPINVTETGGTYNGNVWSATTPNGAYTGTSQCNGWTSTSSGVDGHVGDSSSTSAWTTGGTRTCNSSLRVYCFEQ